MLRSSTSASVSETKHNILDLQFSLLLFFYQGMRCRLFGTKRFAFFVVSGSSHVVAHMMATGDLHGR
jgi:hypothetical protein